MATVDADNAVKISTACPAPTRPRAAVPMAAPAAAHMAKTFTLATVRAIAVMKARPGPIDFIAAIHFGSWAVWWRPNHR